MLIFFSTFFQFRCSNREKFFFILQTFILKYSLCLCFCFNYSCISVWRESRYHSKTGTGNRCTKMRYKSIAWNAILTSANTKSGRWSAFFWSWWKLLERFGMVSKKDAAFISWPNYHRKKSQLLCYTRGKCGITFWLINFNFFFFASHLFHF